jgi:hypothetical protein
VDRIGKKVGKKGGDGNIGVFYIFRWKKIKSLSFVFEKQNG